MNLSNPISNMVFVLLDRKVADDRDFTPPSATIAIIKRGVEPLGTGLSFVMVSSSASEPAFGRRFKGHTFEVHNANNGSDEDPRTLFPCNPCRLGQQ